VEVRLILESCVTFQKQTSIKVLRELARLLRIRH
jgi:hypothetical protein